MSVKEKAEVKYPISEIFVSPQGEGNFSGQLMLFVRLAGCNVGKSIKDEMNYVSHARASNDNLKESNTYGKLPIWQEECQAYVSGKPFLCDTDFRIKDRLTPEEIIAHAPNKVTHMCITGGEPLIHDIKPLVEAWLDKLPSDEDVFGNKNVHIETSGTKILKLGQLRHRVWITVSPKKNCTMEMAMSANEVKFLVDENFDESIAEVFASYVDDECIIWVSPVNGVNDLNKENMAKCVELIHKHPNWRISVQQHKILGVR